MNRYSMVAESDTCTVVGEYKPAERRATRYQSEAELEREFIALLEEQAYEYVPIASEEELTDNLRAQLERLNGYRFSDPEWERFFTGAIANKNEGIVEKTKKIQDDPVQPLRLDSGETKNIRLIDGTDIHNNSVQVINQYEAEGARTNRYDVTILVNGLPLVHVELKRRGVELREAFNQISRYQRESFWAGSGLFEYVQLFVISNGTHTKYYSNTTRDRHLREKEKSAAPKYGQKTSDSFEFTSWWADAHNRPILDLMDFGRTFFAKHALLNILTRYCVFNTEKNLLVMRPYQIVATERILNRVAVSANHGQAGSAAAGGYVWHTTGSGKTLTSFKTAQLALSLPGIDKVLFVVDRKDLDYQTMKEYDRFEKGAANSSVSTAVLRQDLEDPNSRIIITTIQKLDRFIKTNRRHRIFGSHIVMIFDECHRSQFGDMHQAIVKNFTNYHLFGFTGTPIFAKNAAAAGNVNLRTTEQVFGDRLHTYTIVDAISDKNVLPFHIDYIRTVREADQVEDAQVRDIDRERVLMDPQRITNVVQYIREHFTQKTKRNSKPYTFSRLLNVEESASARHRHAVAERQEKMSLSGFNSIFAVSSIDAAKAYYAEFRRQQKDLPGPERLKIATIFSYGANEDDAGLGLADENPDGTDRLDASSRDFLDAAIKDYNGMFDTNYDTSGDKFQNYYRDVSLRTKNREIDLLIVVNMFLTGFDATTLNTLWADKNLRMHGLLQAYSRTNRILNSVKNCGNIVTFRNLEKATNDAVSLFGDRDACGIVLLKSFSDYYNGYDDDGTPVPGYTELIGEMTRRFPVGEPIVGEENQKDFIRLYGKILKLQNILTTFDDFAGKEILSERDGQDYRSMYIGLYEDYRKAADGDKEDITDDVVFEMELVKQVDVTIDYILNLIEEYQASNRENTELRVSIAKTVDSSVELRNKKDLIERFIDTLNPGSSVGADWPAFVKRRKIAELEEIITEENLDPEATYRFMENAFRDRGVQANGIAITKILPPVSRFGADQTGARKKETVLGKLTTFFNRFFDISAKALP